MVMVTGGDGAGGGNGRGDGGTGGGDACARVVFLVKCRDVVVV